MKRKSFSEIRGLLNHTQTPIPLEGSGSFQTADQYANPKNIEVKKEFHFW